MIVHNHVVAPKTGGGCNHVVAPKTGGVLQLRNCSRSAAAALGFEYWRQQPVTEAYAESLPSHSSGGLDLKPHAAKGASYLAHTTQHEQHAVHDNVKHIHCHAHCL